MASSRRPASTRASRAGRLPPHEQFCSAATRTHCPPGAAAPGGSVCPAPSRRSAAQRSLPSLLHGLALRRLRPDLGLRRGVLVHDLCRLLHLGLLRLARPRLSARARQPRWSEASRRGCWGSSPLPPCQKLTRSAFKSQASKCAARQQESRAWPLQQQPCPIAASPHSLCHGAQPPQQAGHTWSAHRGRLLLLGRRRRLLADDGLAHALHCLLLLHHVGAQQHGLVSLRAGVAEGRAPRRA